MLLDTELPNCPVKPKILIGVCHRSWAFTLNPSWLTFKHWTIGLALWEARSPRPNPHDWHQDLVLGRTGAIGCQCSRPSCCIGTQRGTRLA